MPTTCLGIAAICLDQVIVIWKGGGVFCLFGGFFCVCVLVLFVVFLTDSTKNFGFLTKSSLAEKNSCMGEGHFKNFILKATIS